MMDPRSQYKSTQATSWTRIDMLLHIYDHAICALKAGMQALDRNESLDSGSLRRDAQTRVMLIVEGLDLKQGEVPQNIMRICTHILDVTCRDDACEWERCASLLEVIRSGFAEVQDEARQAEADGAIPPLEFAAT